MRTLRNLLLAAACLLAAPAFAQTTAPRDAAHDFDFVLGTFHTHIRRLVHPLSGANEWTTYDGTKTDVPTLNGLGSLEQIEADGPSGHLEFVTLRLYNTAARQWSLYFSSSKSGRIGTPSVGAFAHGVGTFLDLDVYDGRTVLVRQLWAPGAAHTYHFEQAFSADFGKSWETNFIAELKRVHA